MSPGSTGAGTARPVLVLAICLLLIADSRAGEITSIGVSRDGEFYRSTVRAIVNAPPQAVFAAMTDYENLIRLNPAVIKSRIVKQWSDDRHRVYTETRLCALWFCVNLGQTQDMVRYPPDRLEAVLVPHTGHFRSGYANWRFDPGGQRNTKLSFDSTLEPSFWIPPVLDVWILKRMLENEARRTIAGLEAAYRASPNPVPQPKNQ